MEYSFGACIGEEMNGDHGKSDKTKTMTIGAGITTGIGAGVSLTKKNKS